VAVEEAHVSIKAERALHSKAKGSGRCLLVEIGWQSNATDSLNLAGAQPAGLAVGGSHADMSVEGTASPDDITFIDAVHGFAKLGRRQA
jgi:hypothetical protein